MSRRIVSAALVAGFSVCAQNASAKYCMAIRGNGENAPAHWGAMANAIETYGLPSMLAGGSSASASSFLLESVMVNPAIAGAEQDKKAQAKKTAFLLKSFEGFTMSSIEDTKWKDYFTLFKNTPKAGEKTTPQALATISSEIMAGKLTEAGARTAAAFLDQVKGNGLFYGPAVQKLHEQLTKPAVDAAMIQKLAGEVQKAASVLGKFDAEGDHALFVRNGLVNFDALTQMTGKMADFYSMAGATDELKREMSGYIGRCSQGSVDAAGVSKSWSEIVKDDPSCQAELAGLRRKYFAQNSGPSQRLKDGVGAKVPALISTTVIKGNIKGGSADRLRNKKREYEASFNPEIGRDMGLDEKEVRIGYWGRKDQLLRAKKSIDRGTGCIAKIDKSKRFENLGSGDWATALRASMAEPGLSSFVELGNGDLSTGGWGDLGPAPILRAAGCGEVVLLTRKGGPSKFSAGVHNRMLGLNYPWAEITSEKLAKGNENDKKSRFAKIFNVADPESTEACSTEAADAAICTDWDKGSITDSFAMFGELIEDGRGAGVFEKTSVVKSIGLRKPKMISDPPVGCGPLARTNKSSEDRPAVQ